MDKAQLLWPDQWPDFAFSRESHWGKALVQFLESYASPLTFGRYRQALLYFFTNPKRRPDEYTQADVSNFIHAVSFRREDKGKRICGRTVNNRLCILSSFYRFAQSYGVTAPDGKVYPLLRTLPPTAGIRYAPKGRPPYKSLDEHELSAFFSAIGDCYDAQGKPDLIAIRDRAMFLTLFWTARRRSEILELTIGDLEQSPIVDGGTRRDAVLYHFRGKGKKAIDDLAELPPQAAEALYLWLAESGKLEDPQPDDAIFTSLHTDPRFNRKRPMASQTLWNKSKQYAALGGIPIAKCSPHSFRHASARARWEATGDLEQVRQVLRHQNIATTHIYVRGLSGVADPGAASLASKYGNL